MDAILKGWMYAEMENDNVFEAYLLYEQNGTNPWIASKNCWAPPVQKSATSGDNAGEK